MRAPAVARGRDADDDHAHPRRRDGPRGSVGSATAALTYAALGFLLAATRTIGLDHGLWHDEVATVVHWIEPGPHEIFFGPLNHQLMVLLAWLIRFVTGDSEIAFRLISVLPFICGVALVTVWLHRRSGALSGVLFLFLATASPLLLDISRQARGYGLAFLAMAVVVIAGIELGRSPTRRNVLALLIAGAVGTMTLPQLGFAFVSIALVVGVTVPALRRQVLAGMVFATIVILSWYAPHLGTVRSAPSIQDGVQIDFPWVATASIDQILLPGLLWIDGTALVAGVVWLPLVVAAVVVIGASPLLRDRVSALVLCSGPIVTMLVLWLADAYVIPRYVSFLLVPLFILVATGAARLLSRSHRRDPVVRSVVCIVALVAVGVRFATIAPDVLRYPREAYKEASRSIASRAPSAVPVVAYLRNPEGLHFYLDRPFRSLEPDEVATAVCMSAELIVFVQQPFGIPDVEVPCLGRPGVEKHRFRQYARGGETNVWFVPPER